MSRNIRIARESDTFSIQKVYQMADESVFDNSFFSSIRQLKESFAQEDHLWVVFEENEKVEGFAWLFIDEDQQIAKISRLLVAFDSIEQKRSRTTEFLTQLIQFVDDHPAQIDILWANSRPLDHEQNLPAKLGFRVLGIFPNGREDDYTAVTALIAYFYNKCLELERITDTQIHPKLAEIYNLAKEQCNLELPKLSNLEDPPAISSDSPPKLEIIEACDFVTHRFNRLKSRNFLSTTFYPFHEPNALITNPDQTIELFVRTFPAQKMVTVVAERIELNVDPIKIYQNVCRLLRNKNYTYIEVINDAGDIWGTEYLMKAGFVPCCYFPCLKKHHKKRRDYVVMGRSFEHMFYRKLNLEDIYLKYLRHYHKLANELHQMIPQHSSHEAQKDL